MKQYNVQADCCTEIQLINMKMDKLSRLVKYESLKYNYLDNNLISIISASQHSNVTESMMKEFVANLLADGDLTKFESNLIDQLLDQVTRVSTDIMKLQKANRALTQAVEK